MILFEIKYCLKSLYFISSFITFIPNIRVSTRLIEIWTHFNGYFIPWIVFSSLLLYSLHFNQLGSLSSLIKWNIVKFFWLFMLGYSLFSSLKFQKCILSASYLRVQMKHYDLKVSVKLMQRFPSKNQVRFII